MKKVVSFRLEKSAEAAARTRAQKRKQGFTSYLESVVLADLDASHSAKAGERSGEAMILRVIRMLRDNRGDLRKLGLRHAEIFGSLARGEDRPDSDIDIVVDIDPTKVTDLFAYSRMHRKLEMLLGRPVELARRDRLRADVAAEIERDGILAF